MKAAPWDLDEVFKRVLRRDLSGPGFAWVALGTRPVGRSLGALVRAFQRAYARARGRVLRPVAAGVFDQRHTTRSHRDQGPEESYLFLGYEASACGSRLLAVDDLRCARDLGLESLAALEARAHPLAPDGEAVLAGYEQSIGALRPGERALAVINNSRGPSSRGGEGALGLRHRAFLDENPSKNPRRVRSVLLAPEAVSRPV